MTYSIARMGNPVLYRTAQEISDPKDPKMQALAERLIDACYATKGTGIAAPQIFEPFRMVVFHASVERTARHGYDKEIPFTVLLNPIIEPLSDEIALTWEACLSVPGMMGQVPRYKRIRYRGLNPAGEEICREAEDFHAYVVQHECDHLDGILYPMRIKDLSRFGFVDEFQAILSDEFLAEFR